MFLIKEFWTIIQSQFFAIGGRLGYLLATVEDLVPSGSGSDGLLYALVIFVAIDYLTGVMCVISDKKLSSAVGFKGICRSGRAAPAPPSMESTPSAPSAQTCVVRLPLLKPGATGTAGESAQLLLIHRGYGCGGRKFLGRETPDGDFGPKTQQSVKDFQSAHSLEADIEIGPDTWTALLCA